MEQDDENRKETFAPDVESYEGRVPIWLVVVYCSCLIWGAYYLAVYWNSPGTG